MGKRNLADVITEVIGSWWFLAGQSVFLLLYVLYNLLSSTPFDPFPFIFLNLMLSFQAAYTAPIILMSHNRMADRDRELLRKDRENTQKILKSIEKLEARLLKDIDEAVEDIKEYIDEDEDES